MKKVKGYVTPRPDRCTCDAGYRAQVGGPCQYPHSNQKDEKK